jgi:glycosyltransferase involved in cell wall biosynthesis
MRIGFISRGASQPWGGSELLWSQCAHRLLEDGHQVFASVPRSRSTPQPVRALRFSGAVIDECGQGFQAIARRVLEKISRRLGNNRCDPETSRRLLAFRPDLVCVSNADTGLAYEWMLFLRERGIPYVSISQMNAEWLWPIDERAFSLLEAHSGALASYFVAEANLRLLEAQVGTRLGNARVVRNPFQVPYRIDLEWPAERTPLRLACVGRLHPGAKGQDLILEIMAREPWRSRDISISFFGAGESEASLKRYADVLGVTRKVSFRGYEPDVTNIWKENHALLLPSRYEGLPIAVVEAMLCGRIPIVTQVGGNAEVVTDGETGFLAPAPTVLLVEAALERAWQRRSEWQQMGKEAQVRIRDLIPPDPARSFADELLRLGRRSESFSR